MPVFASTRAISGTDTPTVGTDDGGLLTVTADTAVTLDATGWVAGRSALAFEVTGSGTSLTFVASGTTVRAAGSDQTVDVQYQSCVALYTAANVWTIHKGLDPADFATTAQGALADSAMQDLVDDTTPQLGGNLDVNGFTVDGRDPSVDGTKLDGIEANATADQTAADIRALGFFDTSNDGTGSGLDADTVDGNEATALLARANHTGTQTASTISDFDTEVSNNSSVAANTAKTSNVTHTGEVTGATALTVDKTAITGKTLVTPVAGADHVLIADASDSDNLKKAVWPSGGGSGPTIVLKSADETVASSTTLQDDDELLFAIGANDHWVATFTLFFDTNSGPDFSLAITWPSGGTGIYDVTNSGRGSDNLVEHIGWETVSGTAVRFDIGTVDPVAVVYVIVRNGATAGNVTLRWAQASSNVVSTTVKAGSFLVAHEV